MASGNRLPVRSSGRSVLAFIMGMGTVTSGI